jgi:hypothetical protein
MNGNFQTQLVADATAYFERLGGWRAFAWSMFSSPLRWWTHGYEMGYLAAKQEKALAAKSLNSREPGAKSPQICPICHAGADTMRYTCEACGDEGYFL